jgi:hypothetical protein
VAVVALFIFFPIRAALIILLSLGILYAIVFIDYIRWFLVLCFEFDVWLFYSVAIRIPTLLFIQLPLALMNYSTSWISHKMHVAVSTLYKHKIRSSIIIGISLFVQAILFGLPLISDLSIGNATDTEFWIENTASLFITMTATLGFTMGFNVFWDKIFGIELVPEDLKGVISGASHLKSRSNEVRELAKGNDPDQNSDTLFDPIGRDNRGAGS